MAFSARPAAGYHMVLIEPTGFTPARLMMAPVGVRLLAGVHAVAGVAVPVVVAALREPEHRVDGATEDVVLFFDHQRSTSHVAAWVEIARLKTTFQVAFDEGLLESGRDLRLLMDVIGDVDITSPINPWSVDECLERIRGVIGRENLQVLRSAQTPEEDDQFVWSAIVAESVIAAITRLSANIHALIILNEGWMQPLPRSPLYDSCPSFLSKLIDSVSEFSAIVESTKFKRPQSSIRFRMLESHALALEHVYAVASDLLGEVCQGDNQPEWKDITKNLTNRRITLFEKDMGLPDYMFSIGLNDTKEVIQFMDTISWAIRDVILGRR